ncbi:MAG: hypothetical protein IEMM0008_0773 [bacterium]|nr:MAG: hypothetical protein IEMM0008_0773 [bacterium]
MKIKTITYKNVKTHCWVQEKPKSVEPSAFETIFQTPKELGWSEIRSIHIRDGMGLHLFDQSLTQTFTVETQKSHDLLELD